MEKVEMINDVKLNLKFYKGEDIYSDGNEVENQILGIVKNNQEQDFNEVIFNKKDWPIMYHLSRIRQNIAGTIALDKHMTVLEIGAGCGAVTGILADKSEKVTCIELSKKRSIINAYRNKNKSNIEIIVGNFQDIEKELGQFDCITLIGVFEYADAYIDAENPYLEFLNIIKKHLNLDGKIIIAIENRWGLKYFSGCREDHFGSFFEGIEDYSNTKGVKTFTRKELEKMFKEVGMNEYLFYYPYPDYKFPLKIFSDRYLPKVGEFNTNVLNFDSDRMLLFDEAKVFNTIIKEDMFPMYSNSFLVEIGRKDNKVVYEKFSNDRAEEFAIYTDMVMDQSGTIKVRKYAAFDKGSAHIENIFKWSDMLKEQYKDSKLLVCESIKEDEKAVSEFIEGRTLEEIADLYISEGKEDEAEKLIKELIGIIIAKNSSKNFEITPEFVEVFGKAEFEGEMHTGAVNDIDMTLNNIIEDNGVWRLIDYEWSFEFPVPTEFIIYRMVHYYLEANNSRNALKNVSFIEVSDEDRKTFEGMEKNFQNYVKGHRHIMWDLYKGFGKEALDVRAELCNMSKDVKLYKDYGKGYSEGNVHIYKKNIRASHKYTLMFEVEKGVKRCRLVLCEHDCALIIDRLIANGSIKLSYKTNGVKVFGDVFIFTGAPWIEFKIEGDSIREIYMEYTLDEGNIIQNLISVNKNLRKELDLMKNSRSWKLTRPLRDIKYGIRNTKKIRKDR